MRLGNFLLPALMLILPFHSMAWGVLGHRVVGGIAEKYLTAQARKEIQKLLGDESLAMVSNWADFIKSDTAYNYLSSWHYADVPGGMTAAQFDDYLKKDNLTDAYTRLNFIIAQLKTKTLTSEKKVFYLKLLIHLTEDVHQPMHVAHPEDKGGNNIRLYWFSTPTNLHRLWDENLVEFQQLSYTEYVTAINHATTSQVKQWQQQPLSTWLYESYQIAGQLYLEVHPDDKLSYPYNYYHVAIVNSQLLKGGIRLAGLLNGLFG